MMASESFAVVPISGTSLGGRLSGLLLLGFLEERPTRRPSARTCDGLHRALQ